LQGESVVESSAVYDRPPAATLEFARDLDVFVGLEMVPHERDAEPADVQVYRQQREQRVVL